MSLQYTPTEKISVRRPVQRLKYIVNECVNRRILDLGCFDETALIKENSETYLFQQISNVAAFHIGVDNSSLLPDEGIVYSEKRKILKGSIYELDTMNLDQYHFDVIVAGELIEHLPDTLKFFSHLKENFGGKRLICSTPNATSFSNLLLSLFKRESCHIDHYQIYSYKTLNTLCRVSGFSSWQIIPYHVKFTEMIMAASGIKRSLVKGVEKTINGMEYLFPLTGGGYIIDIRI